MIVSRGCLSPAAWRALACCALLATSLAAGAGDLTLLVHPPETGPAHPPLIVLLHGSGADERDMIGLWAQLPRGFAVVSPRAPFASAGGGYRWYRQGTRAQDIALSRTVIDLVVDEAKRRFDAGPVFVAGFSQGGVMAYELGLREPERFRGAAVLSGALFARPPKVSQAEASRAEASRATPFFIGHGTADRRIPFAGATAARDALARAGVPVAFHAYPGLGHGTGDAEIADLAAWLTGRVAAGERP